MGTPTPDSDSKYAASLAARDPSTSVSIAGPSAPSSYGTATASGSRNGSVGNSLSNSRSSTPTPLPVSIPRDIETGLLPEHEYEHERPRTPLGRTAKVVRRVPGVDAVLRVVNKILGPHHRQVPPPPTPGLSLSMTCRRRSASTAIDTAAARVSRRWRLQQWWFVYLLLWATGFVLLIRAAYYLPHAPETLGCTASLWPDWPPDYCGENATECLASLAPNVFKCPGGCQDTPLGNPRWVGNESVMGVPLIVGGGDNYATYRADSWICAAGVHAGLVSPTFGGCIAITPLPYPEGWGNYAGKQGAGGLRSLPFQPQYSGAFRLTAAGGSSECMEFHWPISAYNIVMLFVFTALFTPPAAIHCAVLFVLGYLQITLVSDARYRPPNWSYILGGVPQVLLTAYWAWNVAFRRTLSGFINAGLGLDMAIWQGAGYWIGIESSTLFAKIPISRLGYGTLSPGGVTALVIIILIVLFVVVLQVLEFRRLGYFRYYLKRYLPLVPILILLANLGNGYYLRLHHYLLCLAGIPVLSLPNRISLFGQAFLLGFFLDGVGRWGWASILEHADDLIGDAAAGTLVPIVDTAGSFISWNPLNSTLIDMGITAVSVLFDDLLWSEKFMGSNFSIQAAHADPAVDHYFRLAFHGNGTSLDYTDPWTYSAANASWIPPR